MLRFRLSPGGLSGKQKLDEGDRKGVYYRMQTLTNRGAESGISRSVDSGSGPEASTIGFWDEGCKVGRQAQPNHCLCS